VALLSPALQVVRRTEIAWARNAMAACLLTALLAQAAELPATERQAILEAARGPATVQAGQPVRFVVTRLNVDANWAVLVGSLVQANGGPLDWRKAKACDPQLDKMLWAVLARADGRWRVAQLDVCATEPPYWMTREQGGFVWPCGVYAGLSDAQGRSLEAACRALNR